MGKGFFHGLKRPVRDVAHPSSFTAEISMIRDIPVLLSIPVLARYEAIFTFNPLAPEFSFKF
jgi:hypothetical protein